MQLSFENQRMMPTTASVVNGSDAVEDNSGRDYAEVGVFLASLGLREWVTTFRQERIDGNALNLLQEDDLKVTNSVTVDGGRVYILQECGDRRQARE